MTEKAPQQIRDIVENVLLEILSFLSSHLQFKSEKISGGERRKVGPK